MGTRTVMLLFSGLVAAITVLFGRPMAFQTRPSQTSTDDATSFKRTDILRLANRSRSLPILMVVMLLSFVIGCASSRVGYKSTGQAADASPQEVSEAQSMAAQAATINAERLALLDSFQVGVDSLQDFLSLGWTVEEAFYGIISLVGYEVKPGGGDRLYTVGLWETQPKAVTARRVSTAKMERKLWEEDASSVGLLLLGFGMNVFPSQEAPVVLCRLHFLSGPLVSKECEGL